MVQLNHFVSMNWFVHVCTPNIDRLVVLTHPENMLVISTKSSLVWLKNNQHNISKPTNQ